MAALMKAYVLTGWMALDLLLPSTHTVQQVGNRVGPRVQARLGL